MVPQFEKINDIKMDESFIAEKILVENENKKDNSTNFFVAIDQNLWTILSPNNLL